MTNIILFISLLLVSCSSYSSELKYFDLHIDGKPLYEDKQWLALGHYKYNMLSAQWISEADHHDFFISPEGKISPKKELKATIHALFFNKKSPSKNVICQFPARYYWLRTKFYDSDLPKIEEICPNIIDWLNKKSTDHLSIIFASAYLGNPSSMFGHTFLRFYNNFNKAGSLNTETINYAADANGKQGIIDFVVKGLFGGLPGITDELPFYRRLRSYSENEGRDLWEYHLNFAPNEIKLIALHLFEIKDKVFDYFFLDENCSYRTLAVLAVAKPDLSPFEVFSKYAIPIDTIRLINDHQYITGVYHWPSATKQIYYFADQLTQKEQELAVGIATGKILVTDSWLTKLDSISQSNILFLSHSYLSLLINRNLIDFDTKNTIYNSLLNKSINLSARPTLKYIPPHRVTPEKGHKTSRIVISHGTFKYREKLNYVGLSIRGAYHDLTDPIVGYSKGATVGLLNIELRKYNDSDLKLEKFDLLSIQSLSPSTKYFSNTSWQFNISRLNKEIQKSRHLVNTIEYSRGVTLPFYNHNISILAGLSMDTSSHFNNHFGIEAKAISIISKQTNNITYQVAFEYGSYISGINSKRLSTNTNIAYSIRNQRFSISAGYVNNEGEDLSQIALKYHYYY